MNTKNLKFNQIEVVKNAPMDYAVGIKIAIIADTEDYHMGILEVAPGKQNGAHYHTKYAEIYQVISGEGYLIIQDFNNQNDKAEIKITKDDVVKTPVYTIHQIKNTGTEPLIVTFFCHKNSTVQDRHVL
ncbi:MAG: cupin domain-containing protein [Fusobacteria bacterium]|nr:cupin domain-containing protein [Fusobacteriota bacterium]